jgi:hypothetical protein
MFIGRRTLAEWDCLALNGAMPQTSEQSTPPQVIALVRDLMFSSRIRSVAKDLGVAVLVVRDPAQMVAIDGDRLLVDLNQEGAIEAARQWRKGSGGVVTGFVSHVDVETINRARAAGIDQVMARSRFVEVLPELLKL